MIDYIGLSCKGGAAIISAAVRPVCIGKVLVASPLGENSIFYGGCEELTITYNAAKNLALLFRRAEQVIDESIGIVSRISFCNGDLYWNDFFHRVR